MGWYDTKKKKLIKTVNPDFVAPINTSPSSTTSSHRHLISALRAKALRVLLPRSARSYHAFGCFRRCKVGTKWIWIWLPCYNPPNQRALQTSAEAEKREGRATTGGRCTPFLGCIYFRWIFAGRSNFLGHEQAFHSPSDRHIWYRGPMTESANGGRMEQGLSRSPLL
jgi:hypothetical protein